MEGSSVRHLRVIGGPADGQRVALQGRQNHYVVRTSEPLLRPFSRHQDSQGWVSYRETLYVIDTVKCGPEWEIEYLRPADWTSIQALRHVFQ
jgi:hypothetical protein